LGLKTDFNFEEARAELPKQSGRWRWLVTLEGTRTFFHEEEPASTEPMALSVSPIRVGSCNWDARYKTVSYLSHVQAMKSASTPEVILLNEHGHIGSGARTNIFWRKEKQIFTPSREAGCRRGVVRAYILKHRNVRIGHFPSRDLLEADEIFLTNSMMGIVSVNELKGRNFGSFPLADRLREEYAEAIEEQLAEAQNPTETESPASGET